MAAVKMFSCAPPINTLPVRFVARVVRFVVISLAYAGLGCARPAAAQLQTLSEGNADLHWREAQLEVINQQLAEDKLPDELETELRAQKQWLTRWDPKSSSAEAEPEADAAAEPKEKAAGSNDNRNPLIEPLLDPENRATKLRKNLFATRAKPTTEHTASLEELLAEHSADIGLRQLQLHWTDQPRFRNEYWKEISEAGSRVISLIAELPPSEETKTATAFAYYRKARALAHCLRAAEQEKPSVTGAEKLSLQERQEMQDVIGDCGRQIEELVGLDHNEFFQLRIYLLRRDGWAGQALEVLDAHASAVERSAYLQEKQAILQYLHWTGPATQVAAEIKSIEPGKRRLMEIQFVPIERKR